ncbi:MAG: DUF1109 domain-containing protein [Alphaproteobacteria bacterium]|nr:DUF1109 domain-containing protein [Alphaproteobacteria bacterium]MBU1517005.1 DUF1109 domain-containing protein [Alphaproteobacteria bacterium]MBU2093624.1 DUF1109 domain-containing protein [Alphaproteobacteria bacterium]MBU2151004.1 DUF1109 domain-containing protein [Alphaproteobacteria bacterium]MBU2308776.1 DUF1109 domain-containing protein [Alphaproteobacteria bacterium]
METERLIDSLAANLTPAPSRQVSRRIVMTALVGAAAALVAVLFWLGLRSDLMIAVGGRMFWMKAAYAAILGVAGFACAERLARPTGSARGGLLLAVAALGVLAVIGLTMMMMTPPAERMALWLGQSWRRCPFYILALSIPTLALALLTMRRFAPTRLGAAGAAAGLFAGGVAATVYGLHCGETSPIFLLTWYSLGVALSTALGALLGPWALRWR